MDGSDDNALIAGTVMNANSAREGGGAVFDVVDSGWGSLTFKDSHLVDESSGEFQTAPGVFYDFDDKDKPTMIVTRAIADQDCRVDDDSRSRLDRNEPLFR